jgi:hypothetical protein
VIWRRVRCRQPSMDLDPKFICKWNMIHNSHGGMRLSWTHL